MVTTTLARHCRPADLQGGSGYHKALQLLLILHEANSVTAAIRLSQTLKMCSDINIKGTHSTFGGTAAAAAGG